MTKYQSSVLPVSSNLTSMTRSSATKYGQSCKAMCLPGMTGAFAEQKKAGGFQDE
ncbi:MAG: hypothetical protein LBG15_03865 [Dysgonamonadaceae bacterium]|nr:hypothetical protein [Dysgonamonadaceae bacterium]